MNWNALLAPALRYTVIGALATVLAAYLVFQSGLPLLVLAITGVMFVVLGAGEAGAAPAAGIGQAESGNMESGEVGGNVDMSAVVEGMQLVPGASGSAYSLRSKLLFYGLGLVAWDVVGLAILLW
ncbi:hypothetical protein BRC82_06985 [Halobacteriales archaeon QS_1_67_19]|nr:MAG: hypothetical protein BRC82_06985 [Halobacteriales archaeon QS_1_67_19]